MTRICVFQPVDGCTGESVFVDPYPALCGVHLQLFQPLIQNEARILAAKLHHAQCTEGQHRGLRKDAALTPGDLPVLSFLRGVTL